MAKVDALSRQLDELKDGNIINSYNINTTNSSNELIGCQANSSNILNVELEKLKKELLVSCCIFFRFFVKIPKKFRLFS